MLLILSAAFFPFLKYIYFHLLAKGVTACYLICGTGAHKRMTNPIYWNFTVFIKASFHFKLYSKSKTSTGKLTSGYCCSKLTWITIKVKVLFLEAFS